MAILDPIACIALYRVAHRVYFSPLRILSWPIRAMTSILFGNEIHPRACLGRRLSLAHTVGIVIGADVVAGNDLFLFAHVTIGQGRHASWPTIGERVKIWTGAVVSGPARLGEGAKVGANASVDFDVPPGRMAVGNPGRLLDPL